MPIKISFMHYMKWAVVMLPIVFEEFEVVYIFFATFLFLLLLSIYIGSTLTNYLIKTNAQLYQKVLSWNFYFLKNLTVFRHIIL